jgi:hypothetical protein
MIRTRVSPWLIRRPSSTGAVSVGGRVTWGLGGLVAPATDPVGDELVECVVRTAVAVVCVVLAEVVVVGVVWMVLTVV